MCSTEPGVEHVVNTWLLKGAHPCLTLYPSAHLPLPILSCSHASRACDEQIKLASQGLLSYLKDPGISSCLCSSSCPEWELKEEEDGKAKRTQQRHEGTHGNSKGFTHIIGGQDHVPHFSLTKTLRDEAGRHHGPRVESAKQRGCWEEWPNDLVWSSHPSPLSQSPAGECLQLKGQGTTICSSPLWLTASLSPPAFLSSLLLSLLVCFARNQIQQQLSQNQWVTH